MNKLVGWISLHVLVLSGLAVLAQDVKQENQFVLRNGAHGVVNPVPATGRDPGDLDLVIDISGTNSWDAELDSSNEIITEALGEGAILTGVGWDVTLTTVGASWLSEATMGFGSQSGTVNILNVGAGDDMSGSMSYSSPVVDFTDNALADIPIGPDDNLYIEFFESFDDVADAIDSTFDSGTVTLRYTAAPVNIPTLGPWGLAVLAVLLMGVGVVMLRKFRRRAAGNS